MELLKLLQDRSDLTLLTNSAEAIHVLAQSEIKVVSTGGELNKIHFHCKEELLKRSSAATMSISW